ncbi:MAG: nucleotide exchange factor GrpE [Cyanobacteriota bacterium]|nr:nucleotide exchange factor GrpE [Cyanobacteriota bacterium]
MTSPRERAQLQVQLRQQQEALLLDLLPVLDALDRAEAHWRQVLTAERAAAPMAAPAPGLGSRLRGWLARRLAPPQAPALESSASLARSAEEGVRLMRDHLLEALRRHGLEPFDSLGQPFDPERMRALGQRPAPAGTLAGFVVEEAVRGYLWRQTLLREAQVLVAGP